LPASWASRSGSIHSRLADHGSWHHCVAVRTICHITRCAMSWWMTVNDIMLAVKAEAVVHRKVGMCSVQQPPQAFSPRFSTSVPVDCLEASDCRIRGLLVSFIDSLCCFVSEIRCCPLLSSSFSTNPLEPVIVHPSLQTCCIAYVRWLSRICPVTAAAAAAANTCLSSPQHSALSAIVVYLRVSIRLILVHSSFVARVLFRFLPYFLSFSL
jgi:hypothetical protein